MFAKQLLKNYRQEPSAENAGEELDLAECFKTRRAINFS